LKKIEDDDCLVKNTYNAGDFYNRAYYPFGFSNITEAKNEQFIIELTLRKENSSRQLPLYLIEGDYVLSTEKSTKHLLALIFNDLKTKYHSQQNFFHFWFVLLGLNLASIFYVIFAQQNKNPKA